ncbi:uncharacterized protein LOC107858604 isoform X2 [Capsicum annuum]|uniref:uncharacterized protein LOC107858604 isoform X2 n=1 Tax=Capsicum annuum TaxID=4072 RepID=UPI001FB190F4|nr:uncharacterized protein LOC107858604 isoform X2 [Capsicum annuum]
MLSFITRCTARLIGLYKPLLHSKSNMVCPSPHSLLEVQCCSGYVLPPPYEEHFLRSLSLILSPLSDLVAGGLSETSSSLLGGSDFAYDVLKINIKIAHRVIMKHQSRRYYFGSLSVH